LSSSGGSPPDGSSVTFRLTSARSGPASEITFRRDTPHFDAGLAEWAVLCARKLGIPSAPTAQQQEWAAFRPAIAGISSMQRRFRHCIRQVDISGCFATSPVPASHLPLGTLIGIDKLFFTFPKLVQMYRKGCWTKRSVEARSRSSLRHTHSFVTILQNPTTK
jgi:hypothetical protein